MSKIQKEPLIKIKTIKKFYLKINLQIKYCKNLEKQLKKLSKVAFSPQVIKALSPESTFIQDHITRLKLIKTIFKKLKINSKKDLVKSTLKDNSFRKNKKSHLQDLNIITSTIKLFKNIDRKLEKLKSLANNIKDNNLTTLIEQTIKENNDTVTWLERISYNVTIPGLKKK